MRTWGRAAFIFLLALLALLLALACGRKRTTERKSLTPVIALPATATRTLTPLPARPLSQRLQRVRTRAMQAAARTRELDWQIAPGMIELTGWEYGTRSKEMADTLGGEELHLQALAGFHRGQRFLRRHLGGEWQGECECQEKRPHE